MRGRARPARGKPRKVLVRPGRTGYMYVIDRATGEVLSADAFDTVTAYKGVDLKSGRIIPNDEKKPEVGKLIENVCPARRAPRTGSGPHGRMRTQFLYVPHQHMCMSFKASEVGYIAGTPYVGATVDMYAGPGDGTRGEFMAWDVENDVPAEPYGDGRKGECQPLGRDVSK